MFATKKLYFSDQTRRARSEKKAIKSRCSSTLVTNEGDVDDYSPRLQRELARIAFIKLITLR